jgi:hypothetical protein
MDTRKRLARARPVMAVSPVLAPAVRRSLTATLGRMAAHSTDQVQAQACADALAHFASHGWSDASWDALGVAPRSGCPGGGLG